MNSKAVALFDKARAGFGSAAAKFGGAVTALLVSGHAMAAATGPGDAIAAELGDGPSQLGVVFAAVAILIGLLILWAYMKRAR